jgi:hypothetical protein
MRLWTTRSSCPQPGHCKNIDISINANGSIATF